MIESEDRDEDIARNALRRLIESCTGKSVTIESYEPLAGGLSRVMGKCAAVIDGVPMTLITRGDPPAGQAVIDSDRDAEWAILSALSKTEGFPAPRVRYYDSDGSFTGTKTIVMDYVASEGVLTVCKVTPPDQAEPLVRKIAATAAAIHRTDLETLPTSLNRPASWDSYIDSQIQRWRDVEARSGERDPFFRFVAAWLDLNRPPPVPLSLVHGDYQTGNLLLAHDDGAVVACDWELAHVGDPREDLGWMKWVGQSVNPPDVSELAGDAFYAQYRLSSGLPESVVNRDTVDYFLILSGVGVFEAVVQQVNAFADGTNRSLLPAYIVGALASGHEFWLRTALRLDGIFARVGAMA